MIPLTLAGRGEENMIKKIGGQTETRLHLENLGLIPGASVVLISEIAGNVIIGVRDSRIAISREMANKIIV